MAKGKRKRRNEAQLRERITRQKGRAKRETQLWDRDPQKQYIRRYGWLEVIQDYQIRRHNTGIEKPLKYLTLPGPNASDIGMLWKAGIIEKTDDGTLHVAICDKDFAEYVENYLGNNVGSILAYGDRHLHQELENSHGTLHQSFPFDVINADFCNSLISERKSQLNALTWIFRLQRGQRFLLLLTTKPNPDPPPRVASRAFQAYEEFVVELLKRESINVPAELQTNPVQESELRAEADSLIEWWKNI